MISAFEGFAEEFTANALAMQGHGLGSIATTVGKWNNPTLNEWAEQMKKILTSEGQVALEAGPGTAIIVDRENANGNWSAGSRPWPDVLADSKSWMQVRHLLTHGLATGWRAEKWLAPLRRDMPPATDVLRPKDDGKWALERTGARSCARI